MFLVDNDQAQVFQRREDGAARADAKVQRSASNLINSIHLSETDLEAPNRYLVAKYARIAENEAMRRDQRMVESSVEMLDEGFDIAVRVGRPVDSTLIARRLCDSRLRLVAAPAYLDRAGLPPQETWDALLAEAGPDSAVGRKVRHGDHQVVLALPPRLAAARLTFDPPLPPATARRWHDTPTWMAPHAKFFAVYDTPFWRAEGLSGAAQSRVGPLVEIHDATTADGRAALFGFVGWSALQRATLGRDTLMAQAVAQLRDLFGPAAGTPAATLLQDWAQEPLTATDQDQDAGEHPLPQPDPWVTGGWASRLVLAGSETSAVAPGYLAGAVDAAEAAVFTLRARLAAARTTDAG